MSSRKNNGLPKNKRRPRGELLADKEARQFQKLQIEKRKRKLKEENEKRKRGRERLKGEQCDVSTFFTSQPAKKSEQEGT